MMAVRSSIDVPSLLRIKPGAMDRVGVYLQRAAHRRVVIFVSRQLPGELQAKLLESARRQGIEVLDCREVDGESFEEAQQRFADLPGRCDALVGLGGGRALDTAKYVAFLARLPYYAVPTSLSNDGFCSPRASLLLQGRKRSLACRLPYGVVIDTQVCLAAPEPLWHSGVGDLVAKVTAIADWKLAFHARGEPIDDFAALLSDATVLQFLARPIRDLEGMRLLGTALMLNGIAMELAGSSRPASGSEHLISHALDRVSARPRLHGLQVGVATYLVSHLQAQGTERIAQVLDATGFWRGVEADPWDRDEWLAAARLAPSIKEDFYTVLSSRDCSTEIEDLLKSDPRLAKCIRAAE